MAGGDTYTNEMQLSTSCINCFNAEPQPCGIPASSPHFPATADGWFSAPWSVRSVVQGELTSWVLLDARTASLGVVVPQAGHTVHTLAWLLRQQTS